MTTENEIHNNTRKEFRAPFQRWSLLESRLLFTAHALDSFEPIHNTVAATSLIVVEASGESSKARELRRKRPPVPCNPRACDLTHQWTGSASYVFRSWKLNVGRTTVGWIGKKIQLGMST